MSAADANGKLEEQKRKTDRLSDKLALIQQDEDGKIENLFKAFDSECVYLNLPKNGTCCYVTS